MILPFTLFRRLEYVLEAKPDELANHLDAARLERTIYDGRVVFG